MNFLAPPPVLLPVDNIPTPVTEAVVLAHPASPLGWAILAEEAITAASADDAAAHTVATAYAFARTGYHRSLDRLRAHGWKGQGPVPFDHEPNQGVLRAIAALAKASALIGDDGEYERCRAMLVDADPACVEKLLP